MTEQTTRGATTRGVDEVGNEVGDEVGTRAPALLFLPGWCGDRTVFDGLLARSGRRALAMDLPEHGTRPRTGADVTTTDVVDDAVALLDERGVDRVVPVALSHAGWAAIEMRRRLGPDRVPGVVLLDWMVLGAPPAFLGALAGLRDPQTWAEVRAGLFAMWTTGLDLPALETYVEGMACYDAPYWHRAAREIAQAFDAEGSPLAALEDLERTGAPCPTLHLYAQPDDDDVLAAQQQYAAAHPWFAVTRLPARSHFPMFEVPDQMTAAIEEFAGALR